jgi:hypothetical protein
MRKGKRLILKNIKRTYLLNSVRAKMPKTVAILSCGHAVSAATSKLNRKQYTGKKIRKLHCDLCLYEAKRKALTRKRQNKALTKGHIKAKRPEQEFKRFANGRHGYGA